LYFHAGKTPAENSAFQFSFSSACLDEELLVQAALTPSAVPPKMELRFSFREQSKPD
jgi:hypothetical protein